MRCWLRTLREKAGMTQTQVAKAAGITKQMYSYIENGKRCESDKCDTEKAIAAVLGFDWTLFFPDENEPSALLTKADEETEPAGKGGG